MALRLTIGGGLAMLLLAQPLRAPAASAPLLPFDAAAAAPRFRVDQPVRALTNGLLLCEAEEFRVLAPGWRPINWGDNYYAATFSNTFLSRQAALSAPEQCEPTAAILSIEAPADGRYLVLVRYEAAYRFETQFQLAIEQHGHIVFEAHYGARDGQRLWAFGRKVTEEAVWPWGATENIVWEGHKHFAELRQGPALIRLFAGPQPSPAARRNIDLVLLTRDAAAITNRIAHEAGLPLDGLLTQAGDVYLRVANHSPSADLILTIPPGAEHSPGPIHLRDWFPVIVAAPAGATSDWHEVGHLLDTLNAGRWTLAARASDPSTAPRYTLEFGLADAAGVIRPLRAIESSRAAMDLVYLGHTRYSRTLLTLDEFVAALSSELPPALQDEGASRRLPVYGLAPPPLRDWLHLAGPAPSPSVDGNAFAHTPVGSPQMNALPLDVARTAWMLQADRAPPLCCYLGVQWPGDTPAAWRRRFYSALAHGMQAADLGVLAPAPLATSAVNVNSLEFLRATRQTLAEAARFDDLVATGRLRDAAAALWTGGELDGENSDQRQLRTAADRTLYVAIRHQQLALDVIADDVVQKGQLDRYRLIYLAAPQVSIAAATSLAAWVESGGTICATAGAGLWDETNRPNAILRDLFGIRHRSLDTPRADHVGFEKQDLPFAKPLDTASWTNGARDIAIPVFAARQALAVTDAQILAVFRNGGPAVTMAVRGAGQAFYCAFLPGLSYFKPALPLRPVDRGSTDDSMAHWIPTAFDAGAGALIGWPGRQLARPVAASESLVETALIEAPDGLVVPLINWTMRPIANLEVRLRAPPSRAVIGSAAGQPLTVRTNADELTIGVRLDTADALIFRW
jgi:hypothetical protein